MTKNRKLTKMVRSYYRIQAMWKIRLIVIAFFLFGDIVYTQSIPGSSMYLGKKPPEIIPERFILAVTTGSFAAERIAISNDGETIFRYSATLSTGQPVPGWLSFDEITGRFSGTPAEPAEFTIIVTAADKENAKGLGVFKLTISDK